MKIPKVWVGKKNPTNPTKKEQHQKNKTKDCLVHKWQEQDWDKQYKDYLSNANPTL